MLPALAAVLALSAISSAATLKGTVKNGTTRKPAAGNEVVLLELSQGMNEAARTKTDAKGRFSFTFADTGGPHMVRVNHQNVNYFPAGGMVPPGTESVEVTVYDAAPKVQGISLTVDMMRIQTEGNALQVAELFAVKNASDPPRTQMSDQAFELYLPEGAQVDSSFAAGPGGQPVNSAPVPQSEKNKYAFIFPLRPGETRFQVSYHLPYSGEASFRPRLLYPSQHLVVMLPKSMQFSPAGGAKFQSMGEQGGANVQVAIVAAGEELGFKVAGTGIIRETEEASAGGAQGGAAMAGGRPGGGLGLPEETPDPLHQYRWFILGGLAVVLALGVFYVVTRPQPAPATAGDSVPPTGSRPVPRAAAPAPRPAARAEAPRPPTPAPASGNSGRLLEVLKEELFQLEMERHQGRIAQEEYEKARAALDTTLARAAARQTNS